MKQNLNDAFLSEADAKKVYKKWISRNIPNSKGCNPSQKLQLMEDLANSCIAETIKQKESEFELCDRFDAAYDIIESIWYESAPKYARLWERSDKDKISDAEKKKIERAEHIIWQRRDPKKSFDEGLKSDDYFASDKKELADIAARYLSRPWLRHKFLDWVLLDMMTTNELCAYGEALKRDILPFRKNCLGLNTLYWGNDGNLEKMKEKMKEVNFLEFGKNLLIRFILVVAIPASMILGGYYYDYSGVTVSLMLAYGFIIGAYVAIQLIKSCNKFISKIFNIITGRSTYEDKLFRLWPKMYDVWRSLEDPVISPIVVRDLMSKTTNDGAVWDNAAWVIIDRVIMIDQTVWIIKMNQDY